MSLRNHVPTEDNLVRRMVLSLNDQMCTGVCGMNENMNHLFMRYDFYGKHWTSVSTWLSFSIVAHGTSMDHLIQFGGLGGFSKYALMIFHIIWLYAVLVS